MGEAAQILRVVVASPDDVQAERNCLPAVIEEINRDIARDRGLRLELVRWETDAYPGFHPEGPQGLIDPIVCVEDCDVLIGIFWKRFGTPTLEAQAGTQHEFRRAYAAWQQHQRPQIMVYFNQKPYMPQRKDEIDQLGQVIEFKQQFPKEGLWWAYNGKPRFERLVRGHLVQFLCQWQAQAAAVSPRVPQDRTSGASSPSGLSPVLRQAYLHWVMAQVRAVPLTLWPLGFAGGVQRGTPLWPGMLL
jgi:hypothetical protein